VTLDQICARIEAGYARDLTMFDDEMIGLVQDLCDRTGEIRELIALRPMAQMGKHFLAEKVAQAPYWPFPYVADEY
jgi:hypothetical protein